jgi:excisionase family DNA binding protein
MANWNFRRYYFLSKLLFRTILMGRVLSPRQLAQAVGVSESSLRRWADDGRMAMVRTAGGHRRIPLSEAVQLIRRLKLSVSRPELLGLEGPLATQPKHPGPGVAADVGGAADLMYEHLLHGRGAEARGLVLRLYLEGWPLHDLFDGLLAVAMTRLGELWRHSPRGIAIEHRATDICNQIVNQLRTLIPSPRPDAPLALGGAPDGDPYTLPSQMVSATLADAGFFDLNLGANTPLEAMLAAIAHDQPRVVWLSASASLGRNRWQKWLGELAAAVRGWQGAVLVGGRQQPEITGPWPGEVIHLPNMTELAAFARGMLHATELAPSS